MAPGAILKPPTPVPERPMAGSARSSEPFPAEGLPLDQAQAQILEALQPLGCSGGGAWLPRLDHGWLRHRRGSST